MMLGCGVFGDVDIPVIEEIAMSDEVPSSIEIPRTGNKLVDNMVHSASLAVMSRLGVIAIAVMSPLMGWGASEMWSEMKSTINRQERKIDDVAIKIYDIVRLQTTMETINTTMNSRFDAQAKRLDKHDSEIDSMKQRLYQIPVNRSNGGSNP
jgi:excinuclease UvrABC helicase subunit UvrB